MSDPIPATGTSAPGLAIICGGGSLPFAVADAGLRQGRHVVLFALRGWTDPERVTAYQHHWWRMGHWNRLIRIAGGEGCRDIVFIGSVTRPSWWQIQPDLRALWYVPQIVRLFRGGDDHLQSGIARIIENFGFRLRAPQEIAPEIMMPLGPLGSRLPTERDRADIARGLALLAANSPFDIGQAVVVGDNQVLAVEGPEGTDQMVARVAELRRSGRIRAPAGRRCPGQGAQDRARPPARPADDRPEHCAIGGCASLPASQPSPAPRSWPSCRSSQRRPIARTCSLSASPPTARSRDHDRAGRDQRRARDIPGRR